MRLFVNGLTNSKNQINIWLDIVLPINVALLQLINLHTELANQNLYVAIIINGPFKTTKG